MAKSTSLFICRNKPKQSLWDFRSQHYHDLISCKIGFQILKKKKKEKQFFTAVISQAKNAFEDDATISNIFVLHYKNQFEECPLEIGNQICPFFALKVFNSLFRLWLFDSNAYSKSWDVYVEDPIAKLAFLGPLSFSRKIAFSCTIFFFCFLVQKLLIDNIHNYM